ncbi:Peptidoglycan-N-acetylglucosamine deacetylase [Pseudoalteromonas holothuriae]|uniref:Peptidoglycan-N-acetylglucosamine deacetylase n=1 Tax=Pseudoalteromonas holothuriae TaxID=2963714 RepID=A0A9W4R405_9GAMM|nr:MULTISPECIES: polysaccharide deacetylase family protein [unclassified Pseudoalteromonas]CAH9067174.1 Peptidoglycan-N-acetylglucosamine deacetylase [Pseudoalteromonas sp. CIP111854]CAH9068229.1 Peptidoglycan-N-acetylglucosamine deacetylase [Pseudoalteromonas sp. CIP111951]
MLDEKPCASILKINNYAKFRQYINRGIILGGVNEKGACITFDDGPSIYSFSMLNILRRHNVKATFFMLGEKIISNIDVVREVLNDGHDIAVHGMHHIPVTNLDDNIFMKSIDIFEGLCEEHNIQYKKAFRPPFGEIDEQKLKLLMQRGYKVILWSFDSLDWQRNSMQMITEISSLDDFNHTYLFHDGAITPGSRLETMKALEHLILTCENNDCDFVKSKW